MATSSSDRFNLEAASRLPDNILFGTSTWTYPGWKNLIYRKSYKNQKDFRVRCLQEYAQFPWFRTVGIDHTFYKPPTEELFKVYAELVPQRFVFVSKVWEHLTIAKFPKMPRYGSRAGTFNPEFLSSKLFLDRVLKPYQLKGFETHLGPLVFQFPTLPKSIISREEFFEKLNSFLSSLPGEFLYAVEIRNPDFLTKDYFNILNNSRATHCFNHWNIMPPLREQMMAAANAGGIKADFFVARILTPLGVNYSAAVKLFEPYDSIKKPNPQMRKDVITLARRALKRSSKAFIIVNNRCEGCSPLTIDAIGSMLVMETMR